MRRYLFIILTLVFTSSCIRDVSYEPEMVEDRVILNAQICAEDAEHTVYVGVSKSNTVTSLHGAEIRCIVNGVFSAMASEDERGWSKMQTPYTFKANLKPGDKVRLEMISDYGSAWCETVVPESGGRIRNVEVTDSKDDLNLSIQVEDTSPNRNYYMLRCVHRYERDVTIFFSGKDSEHRIKHFSERVSLKHSDDPILDGAYLGSDKEAYDILGTGVPNIYCIFSDRKFENAAAVVNVSISKKEAFSTALDYEVYLENDIVKTTHWLDVSLCSISKEEYDYLSAISTLKVNDFDSSALMEDAVIPSNVNGGEGFVTAYFESIYEFLMIH